MRNMSSPLFCIAVVFGRVKNLKFKFLLFGLVFTVRKDHSDVVFGLGENFGRGKGCSVSILGGVRDLNFK